MEDLWTITDEDLIAARFRALMSAIARSDPRAVIIAVESADGGCTPASSHPNADWTPEQRTGLAEAIMAQIGVLALAACTGEIMAYWALALAQDANMVREYDSLAPGRIRMLIDEMSDPIQARTRSLFALAMTGDDWATKAAVDLYLRATGSNLDAPDLADYLPPGTSLRDVNELIERYRQRADLLGLPPLVTMPTYED